MTRRSRRGAARRREDVVAVSTAARRNGTSYSRLVSDVRRAGMTADVAVLATLARDEPDAFARLARRLAQSRRRE